MKNTVKVMTVAAILAGCATVAEAAFRPRPWRWRRRVVHPVRVIPRRVVVTVPPKPVVVTPPVVKTIVLPPVAEPPAAKELRAEIARLKDQYQKLTQTRENLKNWLAGPGKDRGEQARVNVRLRLKNVEEQCTLLAGRIAELEAKLAEL